MSINLQTIADGLRTGLKEVGEELLADIIALSMPLRTAEYQLVEIHNGCNAWYWSCLVGGKSHCVFITSSKGCGLPGKEDWRVVAYEGQWINEENQLASAVSSQ